MVGRELTEMFPKEFVEIGEVVLSVRNPVSYTHLDVYKRQVFQDAKGQGAGGVDAAIKLYNKDTVPAYVDVPYVLVTPENMAQFLSLIHI